MTSVIGIIFLLSYVSSKSKKMEACVRLSNLKNLRDSKRIERNLHRILDVSLISINIQDQVLRFHYDVPGVYEEVVRELKRLGNPVAKCIYRKKEDLIPTSE